MQYNEQPGNICSVKIAMYNNITTIRNGEQ